MRDHGGNLDAARARFGGDEWIDLSTGINRMPYPIPALTNAAWTDLPTKTALESLIAAARRAYATLADILPLAGAQAAIQLLPRALKRRTHKPRIARILSPTYNEHAASLAAAGWQVEAVATLDALRGAALGVIVNPNNPDGRAFEPEALLALKTDIETLVVDESFADPTPTLSLAPHAGLAGLFVLRSFGKFYGLAGLRLGFVLGNMADLAPLREIGGPWPVSGAAIEIGRAALLDRDWQTDTTARLKADAQRLDALMPHPLMGGTALFRLYTVPDAARAQEHLAQAQIWSRTFPYAPHWLRLGLPGSEAEWLRVGDALRGLA